MAIRSLSQEEFDTFASAPTTLASLTSKAVEWFADDAGEVLGAMAHHGPEINWSFVVLTRDQDAQFGARYLDMGLWRADARRLLFAHMDAAVKRDDSARAS